jgi:hypothetical protein
VDIRIGIQNSPRELGFETNQTAAEVEQTVAAAIADKEAFVRLTDEKGSLYLVPTGALAYIEIGSDQARRVGFVA